MKMSRIPSLFFASLLAASMAVTLSACSRSGAKSQIGGERQLEAQTETVKERETIIETETEAPELTVEEKNALYLNWPKYDWDHLTKEGKFRYYEDENYTSKIVADVSKVQRVIDWEEMQEGGIDTCILKVGARGYSEGGLLEDSRFEAHFKDAAEAGMDVLGVYFYSQAISEEEAREEAAYVIDKLETCKADKDVIVFYDLETGYSSSGTRYRNYDLTDEEIKANLDAFAQVMAEEGYVTGVYTNLKWHNRNLSRKLFKGYPLWIANYSDQPRINKGFFLWQYTGVAHVKGSVQRLDLNLMFVKKEAAE